MKARLGRMLMRLIAFGAASCAVVLLIDVRPADGASGSRSAPVLLTFDVDANDDVPALQTLRLAVPATFFVSGQFAENHAGTVRSLAADPRGTVGSRSYAQRDLTRLAPDEIRNDLLLSKRLLHDALGQAPRWFRAPFLQVNEVVLAAMNEVGFTHDSSNRERWMMAPSVVELPISSGPGMLATDYELFVAHRMSDAAALAWLIEQYEERALLGRPFVVLMHPRIIAGHAGVLAAFIEHAAGRGASFLGAEDYMRQVERRAAKSVGTWINLNNGPHSAQQVVQDLKAAGISEVFLMAKDPEGNRHFATDEAAGKGDVFGGMVARLKEAGLRVHAWLPVFSDPKMARHRPALAMMGRDGKPSPDWISPSNPDVRAYVADIIRTLVSKYEVDGVHLDYVRYPDLDHDFGGAALERFEAWSGLRHVAVGSLLTEHYSRWTDWRAREITRFVAEIREELRRATDRQIVLSAALIGDAALHYRSLEKYGQSYSQLARHLDCVIPMAYFQGDRQPVDWIGKVVRAARFRIGDTPMLVGVEAYQEPGAWTFDKAHFARSIEQARVASDGVVLYPYLHLFARSGGGRDMPPGSVDALAILRRP